MYRENEWMKNLKIYLKMDKKRLDVVKKTTMFMNMRTSKDPLSTQGCTYNTFLSIGRDRAEHGTIHGLLPNVCKVSSSHLKQKNGRAKVIQMFACFL